MTDILFLLISATLANNFVLTQTPGLRTPLRGSGLLRAALGMAAVTTLVLTLSSACTWLVYHYLLLPFDLAFLRTLVYIIVIAVVVCGSALMLRFVAPTPWHVPPVFLPLILTNCVVLGVVLINDNRASNFSNAVLYGVGIGLAFSLLLVTYTALRERLRFVEAPEPFQGTALVMVTAGLLSLALMGFAGLV